MTSSSTISGELGVRGVRDRRYGTTDDEGQAKFDGLLLMG